MENVDISISLPEGLKQYMDARLIMNDYPDASTYISDLIRTERDHNHQISFEMSLLQGLKSGDPQEITNFNDFKNEILKGANLTTTPSVE